MYYLFEPDKHPHKIKDVPMSHKVPVGTYLYDGTNEQWHVAKVHIAGYRYHLWPLIEDKELLARLNTQLLLVL